MTSRKQYRTGGGAPTVLVVDDEPTVLELFQQVLKLNGYTVAAAADARAAIEVFDHLSEGIDLLVTDIEMPGQSGVDLAAELSSRKPNLPVLFVTAYSDRDVDLSVDQPRRRLLSKPFSPDNLLDSIESILESN